MYRGSRDPMVGIIVRQDMCQLFKDRSGCEWVEIFVPPEDWHNYRVPWPSIALPPNQVFWVDDVHNEFQVNAGAELTLLYKTMTPMGTRVPVSREEAIVEDIRARYLLQALHRKYGDAGMTGWDVNVMRQAFESSGMTMLGYMKRL